MLSFLNNFDYWTILTVNDNLEWKSYNSTWDFL